MKFAISLPAIITGYFKYTNSSKHLVIKFANYNLARVSFSCVNKAVTVVVKKGTRSANHQTFLAAFVTQTRIATGWTYSITHIRDKVPPLGTAGRNNGSLQQWSSTVTSLQALINFH